MKRVISFSIYGNNPKYTIGLLKNIELAKEIYPDWIVYVYYNSSVPYGMIEEYMKYDNVEVKDMTNSELPGMFWRFTPSDVERFISRDADSRLSMREKLAVDEWIKSDKILHILRDHPHHEHDVNGGMFGIKITEQFDMLSEIKKWLNGKFLSVDNKFGDLDFLDNVMFPALKHSIIAHDSVWTNKIGSTPFPTPMEDYKFIGEIYDENDNRYPQYREWMGRKEVR